MSRNYQECQRKIFEPLVIASGRDDLLSKLKTADIPDRKKKSQFKKFSQSRIDQRTVVRTVGSGFIARAGYRDYKCIIVSDSCIDIDPVAIDRWATYFDLFEAEFDEASFILVSSDLRPYYQLKSSFRMKSQSAQVIDIIDENYCGHEIADLMRYFIPVRVFRFDDRNSYADKMPHEIALDICEYTKFFVSTTIDHLTANEILQLSTLSGIDKLNLYSALTSANWRSVFFELYRCIESLFFISWIEELHIKIGASVSYLELARHCSSALSWRASEEQSIERLFGFLEEESHFYVEIENTNAFKELFPLEAGGGQKIGKRIYKIRNQLVHQKSHIERETLDLSEQEWPQIIRFMARSIGILYNRFGSSIESTS